MDGFGLLGPCICLLLFMGLKPLCLLLTACGKLRSSIHRVVWSRRQPMAGVGAVLSQLDGPTGCDSAFCVVWFRFRLLRRKWLVRVVLGMVLIHLLSACVAEVGFRWDPNALAWAGPGLPHSSAF